MNDLTYIPELSSANFSFTKEELDYLQSLFDWQKKSEQSMIILGNKILVS